MYGSYVAPPVVEGHPLVGRSIRYNFIPYHTGSGVIEEVRAKPETPALLTVTVKVTEGTVRNRLFQAVDYKPNNGTLLVAYGVGERQLTIAVDEDRQFQYSYPV